MKKLRVSHLAERDLDDIWSYVASESGNIDIADNVIESITEHFSLFIHTPEAGARREKWNWDYSCSPSASIIFTIGKMDLT